MSLDNDELVPSRYALKVGDIDVLVVSDGVISLPAETTATNADPTVRAAWLKDMFRPPDTLDWALNAVVVRDGGRTILIDAGLGVDPDVNLPRAGRLGQRLEAAGIDLASVTDVVLTHMHFSRSAALSIASRTRATRGAGTNKMKRPTAGGGDEGGHRRAAPILRCRETLELERWRRRAAAAAAGSSRSPPGVAHGTGAGPRLPLRSAFTRA